MSGQFAINPHFPKDTKPAYSSFLRSDPAALLSWQASGIWVFNERGGNTVFDLSGQLNHGAISGASWTHGKYGAALDFNGTSDYIDISNPSFSAATEGTVIALVHKDNNSRSDPILYIGDSGTNNNVFMLYYDSASNDYTILNKDTADHYRASYNQGDSTNQWQHVAFTVDGSGNKFYLDGEQKTLSYSSGSSASTEWLDDLSGIDKMRIGGNHLVTPSYFDGRISYVMIWNRGLSEKEIAAQYRQAFSMLRSLYMPFFDIAAGLYYVTLDATTTPSAAISKQTGKNLDATTTPGADIVKLTQKEFAASTTPIMTLTKQTGKNLAASTTPSAGISKLTAKILAATTTPSALLQTLKTYIVSLAATTAPVATITKLTKKIVGATTTPVAGIIKKTSISIAATTAPLAAIIKKTSKTLSAATTPLAGIATLFIAAAAAIKIKIVSLAHKYFTSDAEHKYSLSDTDHKYNIEDDK